MTKTKDDKGKSDRRVDGDTGKVDGMEGGKPEKMQEMKPEAGAEDTVSQREDAILQQGEEIASNRALMAQAFQPPCPEPERPLSHRSHMLSEMKWLAIDVAQERLWKQCAALAIAIEVGKCKGEFNLKQPPADCRQFSNEIKQLKLEAAKAAGQTTGRRSAKSAVLPAPAIMLELDSDDDPVIKEIEEGTELLKEYAKELGETTDIVVDVAEKDPELTLPIDAQTNALIQDHLIELEKQRRIREEAQYRSYRMEYEAALASHQLAVAEQQAAANAIDAFEIGQSLDLDMIDDGLLGPPRKSYKRRRGAYGVDEYDDRKLDGDRRRAKAYRDDAEPNYSTEGGRYGRRAGAARSRKPLSDRNRNARSGRPDAYPSGRIQGQPGMLSWNRSEDELLLAIVHEFGVNWTLVSEVLSRSLSMQGIHRPSQQCRQRFRQLTIHEGQSLTDEKAYENLSTKLGKQQARDLLMASLPVRDEALVRFLEALAQVGASAKNRILAEEKRIEAIRTARQEVHVSHKTVLNGIMQHTGGRHLSPFELSTHMMNTLAAQRQLPQANHVAAQGHSIGNQNPGSIDAGNVNGQNPVGVAAAQQPPQRPAVPSAAQSVQQISAILAGNKLPNGQELTEEMRKSLEAKRRMYMAKFQQEKAYALRGAIPSQGTAQGQPTGQITSGTALSSIQPSIRPVSHPGINIPGAQQGMAIGPGVQQMQVAPQMQSMPPQASGQKPTGK